MITSSLPQSPPPHLPVSHRSIARWGDFRKVTQRVSRLAQKTLANRAGISVTTINKIEQGGDCTIGTLQKIEDVLGVTLY